MRAIGFHWHAVQRDLLALGFHAVDMFTPRLSAAEIVSFIVAAPPGSSLCHVLDSATLMASLERQQPGWAKTKERQPDPPKSVRMSFNSIAEFEAHRAKAIKSKSKGGAI